MKQKTVPGILVKVISIQLFLVLLTIGNTRCAFSRILQDKDAQKVKLEHNSDGQGALNQHELSDSALGHANEEGHGSRMEPLLFVIIALVIGAATRHFLQKSPLPYTVSLLLFGLGLGIVSRFRLLERGWLESIGNSIDWAGHIDPHVILYVFLPTLIFEAAFAMHVHTFKKTLTNAIILAVPGIIIAMFLTGSLVMLLAHLKMGLEGWDWGIALMFGAVISATDPVAVVSLLKDLGAGKKLGTLIEGESLLNDGSAIVIFMVFFMSMTGTSSDTSPILDFIRVACGGALLGIAIGYISIRWIKRVFNDALIEISIIVAAAYLTFYIAENFLQVSGVLGVVSLGLYMASIGRTRISPEVEHFLHDFWELAAFIANTLIFIIVGVVIAQRIVFSLGDVIVLLSVYAGIHVVRATVIIVFYPLLRKSGYGLSVKDSYVLWYGALRGAIGLALALVVAGVSDKFISLEIRNQFLFFTAGIVTLTLIINATTIKWLVRKLGLTELPPAKVLMIHNAKKYLRQSSEHAIDKIKGDRFLRLADWAEVKEYLPRKENELPEEIKNIETIAEMRRLILEKEKSSYWNQFKEGLLGADIVRNLIEEIDDILDTGGEISLSKRKDLEELWKVSKLLSRLQTIPVVGSIAKKIFFVKLTYCYDAARAFVVAQEAVLKLLESMYRSADKDDKENYKNLSLIEEEINENIIMGSTFLRNLKKNLPEIYKVISTRQAVRSILNHERHTVERLQRNGRIGSDEAEKMTVQVEERMKHLLETPLNVKSVEAIDVLKEVSIMKDIDKSTLKKATHIFEIRVYSVGNNLMKEHTLGDSLFIIARGNVKVIVDKEIIAILGPGSIVGEMSVLTGYERNATVIAETPVTALRASYSDIKHLMDRENNIKKELWKIAGVRLAKALLSHNEPFSAWSDRKFEKWLNQGEIVSVEEDKYLEFNDRIGILLNGKAYIANKSKTLITAPAVIDSLKITLSSDALIFIR